jgi:site-specific DNA recombinase
MSRVDAPREEWILVAEIPPLVSQEQFDRVQARLASNRRFAQRNNKAHPYLLRGLVSCGVCGLACLARATATGHRYYSCTGKLPALFSHREQKCPSRLSPAGRLDELVWTDLRDLLSHPEQASHALARAHGGQWLPQELQARQHGLRRGQASLGQQLERLTEAYLGGVVLLDEYRRRRGDLEERRRQLESQARQLEAQADRRKELAGLSGRIEDFCRRVQQGLVQATFEQRRALVELLIDRVIVTDGEVEIRYVMPTDHASEQVRFCHLRLDYRAGPPGRERAHTMYARLQELRLSRAVLPKLRRTPRLPPLPHPPQPACPGQPSSPASPPSRHSRARSSRGRVGGARRASHAVRSGARADRTSAGSAAPAAMKAVPPAARG